MLSHLLPWTMFGLTHEGHGVAIVVSTDLKASAGLQDNIKPEQYIDSGDEEFHPLPGSSFTAFRLLWHRRGETSVQFL